MSLAPIPIEEIRAARGRLQGSAIRTPLVRLSLEGLEQLGVPPEDLPAEVWLKLENLQPIGSFKLRGAGNAMALAGPERLAAGVFTASAGNMAQGVAWNARRLGIPCRVVVPDHAPDTKLAAIARLGGEVLRVPFDEWWRVLETRAFPGAADAPGLFIHPVSDPPVIAGNGTVGLEILEDLPDVDAVLVPYGGGGLSAGIACALRAERPATSVYACEVETAAPLAAALEAGEPVEVEYTPSFVDGIGGKGLLPEMWPLVSEVLAGSLVVSLAEVAAALRLVVERCHVVTEGAGAAPVAAALCGALAGQKVACVVSGGNIDATKLARVLTGDLP